MRIFSAAGTLTNMPPSPGDIVSVGGGYDMDPAWLNGRSAFVGVVRGFIYGQNGSPALVVELDEPITETGDVRGLREQRTGAFLVLELRYVGQEWAETGTVQVELLSAMPEDRAWPDREIGAWVESHATYRVLT